MIADKTNNRSLLTRYCIFKGMCKKLVGTRRKPCKGKASKSWSVDAAGVSLSFLVSFFFLSCNDQTQYKSTYIINKPSSFYDIKD